MKVLHRKATTWSDKIAYGLVKFARATFDFVSGYKHPTVPPSPDMTVEQLRKAGYLLDDRAWLTVCNSVSCPMCVLAAHILCQRILFLESIAGVPGMVAATLRHLTSLRLMVRIDARRLIFFFTLLSTNQRRDSGWSVIPVIGGVSSQL